MAVKLAERAVDALVTLYQAQLATELAAIVTERADLITLVAPETANYYKREKPGEIAGATTHIEVFDGGYEFDNPYTDSDAQRAVYTLPVTVRLTCFNRDGADADKMETRRRRYQAGLFNVINKNRAIDATDDAIKIGAVRAVPDPAGERDDDGNVVSFQVSIELEITCEEVQS